MIYIKNNFSGDEFDNLEAAKKYMLPTEKDINEILNKENYIGDDFEGYCAAYKEYIEELKAANNLSELADIWNRYTDNLENGSTFEVKKI